MQAIVQGPKFETTSSSSSPCTLRLIPVTSSNTSRYNNSASCQCRISRAATLMTAIVMSAAATRSPNVPPHVWEGMQAAYSFVKDKRRHVAPNMSLIDQLLEYEKVLQDGDTSPALSNLASSGSKKDRVRRRFRDAFAQDEGECSVAQQDASALDRAMKERFITHKRSAPSDNSMRGIGSGRSDRKRVESTPSTCPICSSASSWVLVESDRGLEPSSVGSSSDKVLELRRNPPLPPRVLNHVSPPSSSTRIPPPTKLYPTLTLAAEQMLDLDLGDPNPDQTARDFSSPAPQNYLYHLVPLHPQHNLIRTPLLLNYSIECLLSVRISLAHQISHPISSKAITSTLPEVVSAMYTSAGISMVGRKRLR
ncbi:hypothetical protein V8E55_007689 [Tylopilus felleus]